jgi:hypothetical protein
MPTEYNAGSAKSSWLLDLSPLRASVIEAKRLYAELAQASQQSQSPRGTATVVPRSEAPGAINVGSGPGRAVVDPAAQAAKAEAALLRQAKAEATLMTAQGNRAGAAQRLEAALVGVNRQSIAAIQTETQLARANKQLNDSGAALPRTIAGLSHEAASFAVSAITMGGAVGVATTLISSFADAFTFKANLDASRASIDVLLQGVRNAPAVFAEANAYAAKYKLTQDEMTGALNASTMIMRQSSAPTQQILNVMQRLTVLNPAENIQGAAFSIKELASGDITSIAERFNVSRAAANKMKAEILAGGDAVKILDQYLAGVGVTSEALSAKLDGPIGKMKDLAIQQEQLKLAQAEWAMGPGMKILDTEIRSLTGLTRILSGDWATMGQSASDGFETITLASYNALRAVKLTRAEWDQLRGVDLARASAAQPAPEPVPQAMGMEAAPTLARNAADGFRDVRLTAIEAGQGVSQLDSEFISQAAAVNRVSQATQDSITKQADAIGQDREMAGYKAELAFLAGQVAKGLLSNGAAALIMARDYGIAAGQAAALVAQQAALAKEPTEARLERSTAGDANAARIAIAEKAAAAAQARRDQLLATGSATQVVSVRQQQLNEAITKYGKGSAEAITAQTALIQAQQRLTAERTKAGTSADKLGTKVAGAANAEAVAQRDAMRRIEDMVQAHYDKLRNIQEDYELSSSRRREDFELQKRRLLADGQIKEAQLLEEKYNLDAKRAAEDNARARQREAEQSAKQIADAQEQAGIKADDRERKRRISGVTLAGDGSSAAVDAAGARQAQAEATLASTAGQRPGGGLLRIEFAPISLVADGATLASVVYPAIETMLDEDWAGRIASILVSAPPGGGQGGGVGGPRP